MKVPSFEGTAKDKAADAKMKGMKKAIKKPMGKMMKKSK